MITSTTDLLEQIKGQPRHSGDTKSGTLPLSQQKHRKKLAVHFGTIQSWFIRCSWLMKLNTFKKMLYVLKNMDSLVLILNTLRSTSTKWTTYAELQCSTNFVYDKKLNDHCRSLDRVTYVATQRIDLEWFRSLKEDLEQVLVFIGLARLGGGSIIYRIYNQGVELYFEKLLQLHQLRQVDVCRIDENEISLQQSSVESHQTAVIRLTFSIKTENVSQAETDDPKDVYVIEMETRRNIWNEVIKKYELQMGDKPDKNKKTNQTDVTNNKGANRNDLDGKDDKKTKQEIEEVDQIQLLPIWTVKSIFGYLDAKTLKKVKVVNKYWSYVIADMQKEQKTLRMLEKFISKIENCLPKRTISESIEQVHNYLKDVYIKPKKRLEKQRLRGSAAPKLKEDYKYLNTDKSLITAIKQHKILTSYILPINNMDLFPRRFCESQPLYKMRCCLMDERGYNHSVFLKDFQLSQRPSPTVSIN